MQRLGDSQVLRDTGDQPEGLPSAAHLRELAEAPAKAEQAEVAVARADLRVAELQRELDALRARNLRRNGKSTTSRTTRRGPRTCDEGWRRRGGRSARRNGTARALLGSGTPCNSSWSMLALAARISTRSKRTSTPPKGISGGAVPRGGVAGPVSVGEENGPPVRLLQVKSEASALRKELATAERQLKEEQRSNEKLRRQLEKSEADCKSEREALQRDMKRARNAEREAARKEVRELEVRASQEKRDLEMRASQEQDKARKVSDNDAVSAAKAELLQQHVDALRDELRRKDDDMADQRATNDAERQALQGEKCNALEVELPKNAAARLLWTCKPRSDGRTRWRRRRGRCKLERTGSRSSADRGGGSRRRRPPPRRRRRPDLKTTTTRSSTIRARRSPPICAWRTPTPTSTRCSRFLMRGLNFE